MLGPKSIRHTVLAISMSGICPPERSISTCPHLSERLNQTENEIVKMFRFPRASGEVQNFPMSRNMSRKDPSVRMLDERFTKILKIFKWGPDAEKALEVLKLRVDHRLVLAVLKIDVEVNVKIQFFKWAGKRRNFEHDSTTYMALIRCLDEAGVVGEM
ncbi:Pentatricopeptide repeat superfamily protein [Prunus dulcis]|uniref:Pentatricopeptide repeat superfamily protein n=1 Tax=Prunus dulcis TaxID=3755 RepID=A0A4Y1R4E4_PRUDU|nr:Pentatricopeptide repeat superfamily protein [Prunus dulcis]